MNTKLEMTSLADLIAVADAYGKARGIGRKRVSTIVLNRGATLDGIAEGRVDVGTKTFWRAMLWFSVNWPDGVDWPDDIDRPVAEMAEAAE